MNVKITNFCQNFYRPNPEKVIRQILEKIPEKFLCGLIEVRLFDSSPTNTLKKNCICKTVPSQHSVIEIYMDDSTLSDIPFFSLLLLNTVFLGAVNQHIINYLQPNSNDLEILAYNRPGRVNLQWGYFGIWTPFLWVFKMGSHIIFRAWKLFWGEHIT